MGAADNEGKEPPPGAASTGGASLSESWRAAAEGGVDPLIGTVIGGRYHILSILGKGGMSVVYKASQAPVDRIVAVKTLKMQMMDQPVLVKRFEREVKTLSKLNHPNIVTVFDCILDDRGQPYCVMDCLSGKSLADILHDEVLLDPGRAQHIFIQVCSAVEHAHKQGIIHRDIKPGNIMVDDNARDFVKVVDFGLARLAEESQRLTRTGEIWGSPLYMSPEQCAAQELDARSDLYCFGTVMYQTLTGSPPFRGKTILDTMTMQVNEAAPPMKAVAPSVNVPPVFEQVVRKCLEKHPEDRYQSMAELREALKNVIPGRPYDGSSQSSIAMKTIARRPTYSNLDRLPVTGYNYKSKGLSTRVLFAPALAVAVVAAVAITFRQMWLTPPHPKGVPTAVATPHAVTTPPVAPHPVVAPAAALTPQTVPHPAQPTPAVHYPAQTVKHAVIPVAHTVVEHPRPKKHAQPRVESEPREAPAAKAHAKPKQSAGDQWTKLRSQETPGYLQDKEH